MEIAVRPASERDYEKLCDLYEALDRLHREHLPQFFQTVEGPARPKSYLTNILKDDGMALFLAEGKMEVVGFVHVVLHETPDFALLRPRRFARVVDIAVRETVRRKGVGEALMKQAREWARERGASGIDLQVYAFNQGAIDFYHSLGYDTLHQTMYKPLDSA